MPRPGCPLVLKERWKTWSWAIADITSALWTANTTCVPPSRHCRVTVPPGIVASRAFLSMFRKDSEQQPRIGANRPLPRLTELDHPSGGDGMIQEFPTDRVESRAATAQRQHHFQVARFGREEITLRAESLRPTDRSKRARVSLT